MLTLKLIQENRDFVIERLKVKHFDATEIVDKIIALDSARKVAQSEAETLQNELNSISRSVGQLMKEGKKQEAEEASDKGKVATKKVTWELGTLDAGEYELSVVIEEYS